MTLPIPEIGIVKTGEVIETRKRLPLAIDHSQGNRAVLDDLFLIGSRSHHQAIPQDLSHAPVGARYRITKALRRRLPEAQASEPVHFPGRQPPLRGQRQVELRLEAAQHAQNAAGYRRRSHNHEPRDARLALQQFDADMPAKRPSNDSDVVNREGVEHFGNRVGESGNSIGCLRLDGVIGCTVTRQVERDEAMAFCKRAFQLSRKNVAGARIPMQKQHRKAVLAGFNQRDTCLPCLNATVQHLRFHPGYQLTQF